MRDRHVVWLFALAYVAFMLWIVVKLQVPVMVVLMVALIGLLIGLGARYR